MQAKGGPIEYAESSCSVGFNKIKAEEVKCQVDLHASLFSKASEAEFEELLKMHPKLRPHQIEKSHHIWAINAKIPADTRPVTIEDLKPVADFISQTLDIPCSVYADKELVSLALFWDSRVLGQGKFFDHSIHKMCVDMGIEQSFNVSLQTAFDMDEALDHEKVDELERLPGLLFLGSKV